MRRMQSRNKQLISRRWRRWVMKAIPSFHHSFFFTVASEIVVITVVLLQGGELIR